MFWTRLGSGIVLMAAAIALLVTGGKPLFLVITGISLIGLFELYRAIKMQETIPALIGILASVALDFLLLRGAHEMLLALLVATLMLLMAWYVIEYPRFTVEQIAMVFFGLLYVTVMLSFVFQVRYLPEGKLEVWLIFIGAWGSDTCAYCVGKLIGKHKMPSKLSPNKTMEGCVGGIVGAALLGFLFARVFYSEPTFWWAFALIGAGASIISQIGDLAASAIKRNHEIKDYGKLIPGHGGILDRFDSIIFTAPVVYYFIALLHVESWAAVIK